MANRRGVTLVELMVSMLILTIVCRAWLEIIGIQSARREARRREAVERLAGMMDAFLYRYRIGSVDSNKGYKMVVSEDVGMLSFEKGSTNVVHAVFDRSVSSIGYQLCLVNRIGDVPNGEKFAGWSPTGRVSCRWLVGRLYERDGTVADAGKPFFTLLVCLVL